MGISKTLRNTLTAIALMAIGLPIQAVTDKEMEQAKTIAAQAYLRYANDGSGYLDDFKATSMSELEGKLKAKEKENIKAFKSVKIPSDYASWDKAKLIEFWSVTFFTSPNLAEKGKIAKSRVKSRISAMTIAESNPAQETKTEDPVQEPVADVPAEADMAVAADEALPTAEQAIEKQEEILADQNAIAEDEKEREGKKDNGNTIWYVIALVMLIACVTGLVVFAVKVMKKQSSALESQGYGEGQGSSEANREIIAALKAAEKENSRILENLERMRAENSRLKKENDKLRLELESAASSRQANLRESNSARHATPEKAVSPSGAPSKMPNVIYLGRANTKGLFVRADRKLVAGSSVFILDTRDGLVGTFHVIDIPEVVDMALAHPLEYLAGGCMAKDIEDTDNVSSIVTENSGTAIFEDGCWKVLRKSRIRYE